MQNHLMMKILFEDLKRFVHTYTLKFEFNTKNSRKKEKKSLYYLIETPSIGHTPVSLVFHRWKQSPSVCLRAPP